MNLPFLNHLMGDPATGDLIREEDLPKSIKNRYVQTEGQFFNKSDTSRAAFVDKGTSISTDQTSKEIIADMIDLAKSKNWEKVSLKGSEEFRRLAWLEAESRGLQTSGYKPRPQDLAALKVEQEQRNPTQIMRSDLSPAQATKLEAAEMVLGKAIADLPPSKQNNVLSKFHEVMKKMENIDRLPMPKEPARERPAARRQPERTR